MIKICFAFLLGAFLSVAPMLAFADPVSTSIEMPCRQMGHQTDQACAVVTKTVSADEIMTEDHANMTAAQILRGHAQVYSLITIYRVQPSTDGSYMVSMDYQHHNGQDYAAHLTAKHRTAISMTTRDGGHTWSQPVERIVR